MKKSIHITKKMKNQVIELRKQGESYKQISLFTGIPVNHVKQIVKEMMK